MPGRNTLEVLLSVRDELTGELRQAGSRIRRFASRSGRAVLRLTRRVLGLARSFVGLRGLLIGFLGAVTLRGIGRLIGGVADFGEELGLLNKRLGVSTELLSALEFGAQKANVPFRQLTTAIQRAGRRFAEFRRSGAGEGAEGLRILGAEFVNAVRAGESFEQLLPKIADRFAELEDAELATLAAQKLFDSEGVILLQFLKDGSDGLRKMVVEAKRFGLIVGEDDVRAATKFKDALVNLGGAAKGVIRSTFLPLLPVFEEVLRSITKSIVENRGAILRSIADMLEAFRDALPAIKRFAEGAATAFGVLRDVIVSIGKALAQLGTFFRNAPDFSQAAVTQRKEAAEALGFFQKIGEFFSNAPDFSQMAGSQKEALDDLARSERNASDALEDRARRVTTLTNAQLQLNAAQLASPSLINLADVAGLREQREELDFLTKSAKALRDRAKEIDELDLTPSGIDKLLKDFLRGIERPSDDDNRRALSTFEQFKDGIAAGLGEVRDSFKITTANIKQDVVAAAGAIRNNVVDALEAIISKTGDVGDAFRALARDISRILLNRAIGSLIGSVIPASVGGAAGAAVGGAASAGATIAVQQNQAGGSVQRTGLAIVDKGEQIVPADTVRNLKSSPTVESGGAVVVNVININATDAQSFQRLFDGGVANRQGQIAASVVQEISANRQLSRRIRFA